MADPRDALAAAIQAAFAEYDDEEAVDAVYPWVAGRTLSRLAEQGVYLVTVESLARAMGELRWAWLAWVDDAHEDWVERRRTAFRNAAAAILDAAAPTPWVEAERRLDALVAVRTVKPLAPADIVARELSLMGGDPPRPTCPHGVPLRWQYRCGTCNADPA